MSNSIAHDERRHSFEMTEALLTPAATNMKAIEDQFENDRQINENQIDPLKKLPFPKSAICLLAVKLFERFAFHGIKAVLVIYLTTKLAYSPQDATVIYHGFNTLIFMMCVFGAIISDSWLGKYRTILFFTIAYAVGMLLMDLASMPPLGLPARELTIIALLLVAGGSGCLKPCIMALGGDQFKRPEQDKQMDLFYSLYYMILKTAGLLGIAVTPILRNDFKCFGDNHCFPLTFGLPGSFVLLALVVFLLASGWYIKIMPSENVLFRVAACIWNAFILRWKNRKLDPKPHWLDHAEPKYGLPLVNDVKVLLNVITMFIPIPMFYALNEQTGSRWTIQATQMDGNLGFYTIKPDQMQIALPIMVLVSIVLLDSYLYKLLEYIKVKGSLRRMLFGTFMAATAFLIAGSLELQTEPTFAVQPMPHHAQVRIFSTISCGFKMKSSVSELNDISVSSMNMYQVDVPITKAFDLFEVMLEPGSSECHGQSISMNLTSEKSTGYLIRDNEHIAFVDSPSKDINGLATLRILANNPAGPSLSIIGLNHDNQTLSSDSNTTAPLYIPPSKYVVNINQQTVAALDLGPGSVTTLLVKESNGSSVTNTIEITPPNTIHMLWMIPQYVFLAMGEAAVGVTGLKFAYGEAPNSMKAVVQAFYLFTISGGNMIDVIIVGANLFRSQAHLTFFFAGLLFVDILLFMWLIKRYKRIEYQQHDH